MINPDSITTVRVGELPPAEFGLTDLVPHEISGELKQGTVQQLADTIGAYLGSLSGLAFNPTTVSDGGTLPATTANEWMLVGKGTFHNVGGEPDIVTTEELNALTSNGSFWSLAVEIPINVELAGITQNIRSGYTATTPSEDAVFRALLLKANLADIPTIPPSFPKIQFTGNGTDNVFDLGTSVDAIAVFWNSVILDDGDWSQTDNILTLTFVPSSGEKIKPI